MFLASGANLCLVRIFVTSNLAERTLSDMFSTKCCEFRTEFSRGGELGYVAFFDAVDLFIAFIGFFLRIVS